MEVRRRNSPYGGPFAEDCYLQKKVNLFGLRTFGSSKRLEGDNWGVI